MHYLIPLRYEVWKQYFVSSVFSSSKWPRSHLRKVSTEAVPRLKVLSEPRPVAVDGTLQYEVLHVVQLPVQEGADQVLGVVVGEAQVVPSWNNGEVQDESYEIYE